jgi:Domain of unknown function (DUF4062)
MSTIYVSSTFADLLAHRKALSLAIRRLGHVDVAMEYYLAEDARPLDRCLRDAGSCDLYIGLFARRYGFCPPGEQRSITELEFRSARTANIDSLCFLLAEEAPCLTNTWSGGLAPSSASVTCAVSSARRTNWQPSHQPRSSATSISVARRSTPSASIA